MSLRDSECPVCHKLEREHSDTQSEKCDRVFSRWSKESKQRSWRSNREVVRNHWSAS